MVSTTPKAPENPPIGPDSSGPPLTRAFLEAHPAEVLKQEGDVAPRVTRYELPGGAVVLKEWDPQHGRFLKWWSRLMERREIAHLELLQGLPGVPRLLGQLSPVAFVMEFLDAQPIHRSMEPEQLHHGLDSLEQRLAGLHQRRFVHMDLHQKRNVLVDRAGDAWLVDFGQGLDCSRGWLRKRLFPLLALIDRRAVLKFRSRYAPDSIDASRRDAMVRKHGVRNRRTLTPLRRWLRRFLGRKEREQSELQTDGSGVDEECDRMRTGSF